MKRVIMIHGWEGYPEEGWRPWLKQKVRRVFEPRYKRKLTDKEVVDITDNLSGLIEVILKFKHRTERKK